MTTNTPRVAAPPVAEPVDDKLAKAAQKATAAKAPGKNCIDPEASAMVARALALAPTRQDFERRDGSDWNRCYRLADGTNGSATVTRIDGSEPDEQKFKLSELRAFVISGNDDPDLRKQLRDFSKGLMPSSGRLALLILAAVKKQKDDAKEAANAS